MAKTQNNVKSFPVKKKSRKRRLSKTLKAVITLVAVVAIVCGVILTVLIFGDVGDSAVSRMLRYSKIDKSTEGLNEEIFSFQSGADNVYSSFKKCLVIATTTDIILYSKNGEEIFSKEISLSNPVVAASDSIIAVADIGGTSLYAFTAVSDKLEYTSEYTIIGVSAGDNGSIALITLGSGYKTSVLVFDKNMELAFKASWSSGYAVCAAVSDDDILAAGLLTETDSTTQSIVYLYSLDSTDPFATYSIDGELIVDIGWMDSNTLCCVCENSLVFLDSSGELLGSYDFSNVYLAGYSLDGDGYIALLVSSSQSGGTYGIYIIESDGSVTGSYELSDEILSISVSGKYISMLQSDYLCVYNSDMEIISESYEISGYLSAITRRDGAVILIGTNYADIFVP